jgi:pimeloyl-ACP methyl ester carboxylesterase
MLAPCRTASLESGRTVGYDEYGHPDGPPVFVLHGNPGTRLDVLFAGRSALDECSARVIAPDRPGIGRSTPHPGRRIVDWPAELGLLADALGMERYAVVGGSAGAPYALACAALEPERLTGVAVMSAFAPPDAPPATQPVGIAGIYFGLARRSPFLLRAQLWLLARGLKDPPGMLERAAETMPEVDRTFLAQPHAQEVFLGTLAQALEHPEQLAEDATLEARPWGFHLESIVPPVHIWHGEADDNSPIAAARYLAEMIPDARPRFFPEEGHLSMLGHLPELIELLAAEWSPPAP